MAKKPREPDVIAPVVIDGVRYEAPWSGATVGVPQDGGVVAAFDEASGALLWAISVYPPSRDEEDEDGDVFITAMTAVDDGRTLAIVNQMGDEFRLDLSARTVTQVKMHGRR